MMDRMQTRFKVIDNSGAKEVGLITTFRATTPSLGSIIIVSVKSIHTNSKIKRGDVVKAIVVRTKIPHIRKDGSRISFTENSVIILNRTTLAPMGTRLFGPIPKEIKDALPTLGNMIKVVI